MRINYQYAHAPLLKNRETIQVNALLSVRSGYDCVAEVSALADSTVNRWALTLRDAAESLSEHTYRSLANRLLGIRSRNFRVVNVVVTTIVPLSEHPPKPEPKPEPPKLSTLEKIKAALRERTETAQGFLEAIAESKKQYPDVWTHPDYSESLENFIQHTIRSTFGIVPSARTTSWTIR